MLLVKSKSSSGSRIGHRAVSSPHHAPTQNQQSKANIGCRYFKTPRGAMSLLWIRSDPCWKSPSEVGVEGRPSHLPEIRVIKFTVLYLFSVEGSGLDSLHQSWKCLFLEYSPLLSFPLCFWPPRFGISSWKEICCLLSTMSPSSYNRSHRRVMWGYSIIKVLKAGWSQPCQVYLSTSVEIGSEKMSWLMFVSYVLLSCEVRIYWTQ